MATATTPNVSGVSVMKSRTSIAFDMPTYVAGTVLVSAPIIAFNPPRQVQDAIGSRSNEQLREIASRNVPPQAWFDAEEEDLF